MDIQKRTPIFTTLFEHAKRKVVSFHTPGHKNGQGIHKKLKSFTGRNVYYFDVTVFPEVDSLHDPSGPIKEAQELMAKAYNVDHSFFLVNGSTVGNIAMFMAACNPGDSVILSRNSHKSVLAGITLAGVWPIWIQPMIDKKLDLIFEPTPEQVHDAIKNFPEAKAVFITSPNYNGIVPDIKRIVEICHKHEKLLLVDEAHGPHLKFHDELPISGVESGADLCVQSIHKILSALSQGAVLHYNTDLLDLERLKKVISMLQTTSPNYLILASLDLARQQVVEEGEKKFDKIIKWCRAAKRKINSSCERIFCIDRETILKKGYDLDETKITINVSNTGLTGYEVEEILSKKYNIQVDCADYFSVIAISGIGTTKSDIDKLTDAVIKIDKMTKTKEKKWELELPKFSTETVMLPRDAFFSSHTKRLPIRKAVGYISAQSLTPYPPGVPVLIPGERISQEIVDYLIQLSERAIRISGQEGSTLQTVKVIA